MAQVFLVKGFIRYECEDVLAVFGTREGADWFVEDYQKRYAADFEAVGYDTELVDYEGFEVQAMEVQ